MYAPSCFGSSPAPTNGSGWLLVAVDDPSPRQVVGRQLHCHLVAGQDLDEVHAHLARDVGQDLVTVLQLHPEHRVREGLDYRTFDLDALFLAQSRPRVSSSSIADKISGPSRPTATVCSKCADSEPSRVATVQPSGRVTTSGPPTFTMGSIASTCPSMSLGPRAGLP